MDLGRRVSWGSLDEECVDSYVGEVSSLLNPFLNSCYSDIDEISLEIERVCKGLVECGLRTLPLMNGRRKRVWKDKQLSDLCERSRNARNVWAEAGRPGVVIYMMRSVD